MKRSKAAQRTQRRQEKSSDRRAYTAETGRKKVSGYAAKKLRRGTPSLIPASQR